MRQIKFRAWDTLTNLMLNEPIMLYDRTSFYLTMNSVSEDIWEAKRYVSSYEFMQYTGIKDKNGVEIYEGDIILKQGIGKFKEVNEKSVVKIINGNTYGYYDDTDKELISNMQFPIEVIGNIYENPELLEDKQ